MYVERRTKNEERIKCLAFSVTCALHFRQQLPTLLCYSSRALCNMYSQIFTFVIFAFGLLVRIPTLMNFLSVCVRVYVCVCVCVRSNL